MTIDAKKLAAALRKNAKVMTADYTAQLWRALADIVEQAAEPEPAEHWIGPFAWSGGECPLPPETMVRWEVTRSVASANAFIWSSRRGHFSYLADNPEGWVERPEGWVPPEAAAPFAIKGGQMKNCEVVGGWKGGCTLAENITHIRLLPREAATPEPTPIPADVRDVVREALEACQQALAGILGNGGPHIGSGLHGQCFEAEADAIVALDSLDAAPAEKVLGYTVMRSGGYGPSPMVYDSAAAVRTVLRDTGYPDVPIVKLVEVPDQ